VWTLFFCLLSAFSTERLESSKLFPLASGLGGGDLLLLSSFDKKRLAIVEA
jgi:hypothetical protein